MITAFINDNMSKGKAALMYLCGHPGTGKTSTLNYVLSSFVSGDIKANLLSKLEVLMYNAMTFKDVKAFCFQVLDDLAEKESRDHKRGTFKKGEFDDDEVALMVAKALSKTPGQTKILVVDEIDAFES